MAKLLLLFLLIARLDGAEAGESRLVAEECRKLGFELYAPLAQPSIDSLGHISASLSWKTMPDEWTIHRGDFDSVYLLLPESEREQWGAYKVQVASRPPQMVEDSKAEDGWIRSATFSLASVRNEYGRPITKLRFRSDIAGKPQYWPLPVEVIVLKTGQPVCSFRIRILRPGI